MNTLRLAVFAVVLLSACGGSDQRSGDSDASDSGSDGATADSGLGTGGQPIISSGGSGAISAMTGGGGAMTGGGGAVTSGGSTMGGSFGTGGSGGSSQMDASSTGGSTGTDSGAGGGGCIATECLCAAFAACEVATFTRASGQNGQYVDQICGPSDGNCSVVSYLRYLDTDSARVYRCSFPQDAPCDAEGSGLNASASPYCVSQTCSPSGTPCTDAFLACP
jgi:hypothetical protein